MVGAGIKPISTHVPLSGSETEVCWLNSSSICRSPVPPATPELPGSVKLRDTPSRSVTCRVDPAIATVSTSPAISRWLHEVLASTRLLSPKPAVGAVGTPENTGSASRATSGPTAMVRWFWTVSSKVIPEPFSRAANSSASVTPGVPGGPVPPASSTADQVGVMVPDSVAGFTRYWTK